MLGFDLDEPLTAQCGEHVMDEDREGFRERVLPVVARTAGGRGKRDSSIRGLVRHPMWQSIFFITEQGPTAGSPWRRFAGTSRSASGRNATTSFG